MHELMLVVGNIMTLLIAVLCGMLLGIEGKSEKKLAGGAAHVLIASGSCLLMIISSAYFFGDPVQIAANVAIGIGLVGAGVVVVERGAAAGLRSAASIWIAAVAGLAIGAGLFLEGAAVTLMAYFMLSFTKN